MVVSDEMFVTIMIEACIGTVILLLGYNIAYENRVNLIFPWHRKNVDPDDLPYLCHGVGYGLITIGLGVIAMGAIYAFFGVMRAVTITPLFFVLGTTQAVSTIIRFNGSFF